MPQVLYRKYRSKDFSEIYGQDRIKKVLIQALKDNRVAHAYLFTGPRGTGKTTTARILAKALNCTNRKDSNPCNKCNNCVAINDASFMDLIEIDAASNRGIDEIRELKEKVGFLPVQGTYKVYIIDEVHMLTSEAFNALLKTLEEPPSNIVFILATTEVHKLPQTIISRTQRFDFKLATKDQLREKLTHILKKEGVKFEEEAIDLIISSSGGSFRDSETILEKVLSSTGYEKDKKVNVEDVTTVLGFADMQLVNDLIEYTYKGDVNKAFEVISISLDEGVDTNQFIKQLLLQTRDELTKSVSGDKSRYSTRFLFTFIKNVSEAFDKMRLSILPSLTLEMAILSIVEISGNNTEFFEEDKSSRLPIVDKEIKDNKSPKNVKMVSEIKNVKKEVAKSEKIELAESSVSINSDKILSQWGKLVSKAKDNNPHLAALLVNVVVKEVEGDNIHVEVPFGFHQKQLENNRVRNVISGMMMDVFGTSLNMEIVVNKSLAIKKEEKPEKDDSNVDMVEEVFSDLEDL
ncbi:DNA polymerase III subunit gamma/tau [Candidatus Dojkabacteria bacterium]|uniref:DNA polymerase III subunit gamma/tau n=1 Tax=Candidatus Dojkabacteria bacterium TaxID=2099670 RepID=A0A955I6Y7_9BACT|nr:DNA polymerase III subunit gamma/tau [Candidatus Dojkabacteria bacterium]